MGDTIAEGSGDGGLDDSDGIGGDRDSVDSPDDEFNVDGIEEAGNTAQFSRDPFLMASSTARNS